MPNTTDLNISPYFDDFNANNNYTRILFRPAVPVQARELTQLQTIFQNQVENFANWAFKNGDIVSGCNIVDMPILPFVRIDDFQSNGSSFNLSDLHFTRVVSETSNLQARVITSFSGSLTNYPNTNAIYVQYINTGDSGETTFSNTDVLSFYRIPLTGNTLVDNVATINVFSNSSSNTYSTGNGHGISVTDGTVFLNGTFVKVANTAYGLVNNFGNYAANNVVGFQAVESIITENQDDTLLDNALGYSNENAPGAHRLKITPTLVSLDPETAANTTGFNPIAIYNYGQLIRKTSNNDIYQVVESAVATRVYEESGNFVVNPFTVDAITDTGDINVKPPSSNNVFLKINPGLGYSEGYRVSLEKSAYINLRRGTDTQTNESQIVNLTYGNYFKLNEVSGSFNYTEAGIVYLYDAPQKSITNRFYTSLNPVGNLLGTAKTRCFSYNSGSVPGTNTAVYFLHVFDINLYSNANINNVKSVYSNGSVLGVGDLLIPGLQGTSNKNQLFSFGVVGLKNLKDSSNNNNSEYAYRAQTTTNLLTDGTITVIIPPSATGGVDQLTYGTGLVSDIEAADISICTTSNGVSSALPGNAVVYSNSANVLGISTTFTSNFATGDIIKVGSDYRTITSVVNSSYMVVDAPFSSTNYPGGGSYYKHFPAGKQIPLYQYLTGSPAYVSVTNSTSFTVQTNESPTTSVPVRVDYNVLRTNVSPAKKVIRKNRYVKINTSDNPTGPWCLGISDVHKINAVYAGATYSTSNLDATKRFTFDSGQKDTHYDLSYLHAVPGTSTSDTPNLLIDLDYFVANNTPGIGFFTVESYPIDDANTANTSAIQTKDIPLYIDESGRGFNLRDVIDFRPIAINTANDASVPSAATINPSNSLTINYDVQHGLNVPSYGKGFQSDFTMYLPRNDIVYITSSGSIKTKEGVSAINPRTPLNPDNVLVLSIINIPAYPSLSSDQINDLIPINSLSIDKCRDVSSRITVNLLSNKRYTMSDVGKLEGRITNLEYYTQLSALQTSTKDLTVLDANGLNRFKNGIFVEPFSDFSLSDVSNPEFNMSIDQQKGIGRPKFFREVIKINFNSSSSSNVQKTGRLITLPYTSVSFIKQPYATKYRSAALVAFAWNGTVLAFPSLLNQFSLSNGGTVNMTVDLSSPWQQFADSPFAYNWGGWRSTSNTSVNTAITSSTVGSAQNYNIDINLGYQTGSSLIATLNGMRSDPTYWSTLNNSGQLSGGNGTLTDFVNSGYTFTYTGNSPGSLPSNTIDASREYFNVNQALNNGWNLVPGYPYTSSWSAQDG